METTFGERLYILLQNKGITQSVLAKHLGVSASVISKYVMGSSNPKREHAKAIAEYVGVSYDELIGDGETAEDVMEKKAIARKARNKRSGKSCEVTKDEHKNDAE